MQQLQLFTPPEPKGRRNQRGAELVEFALVFPVLMLFIIAALSLLWLGFMKVAAAQSAKEAARYASVPVNCAGDLGGPLVSLPAVPPTLPDGSQILSTVPTVPKQIQDLIPSTTVTTMAIPDVPVRAPVKLASYQIGPVTTLQTTLTTLQTTVSTLLPPLPSTTTTSIALPTTTSITLPPTTTTSITLPPTTLQPTTTTTLDPNRACTSNFRTYPNKSQVRQQVNNRVPAGLWGFEDNDFNIIYTYNDPACPGAQPADHQEDAATCATPKPNDPPSNSQVSVKVTKTINGPLGVFAGIFDGSNKISANSGGETRGE
jgi:TadE-like protein